MSALCDVLGYTHDTINRLRIRLGLPARTASSRAKRREAKGDPTPAEIEAACAEFRAKHLAKRFAEPKTRQYRKDDETYGRVYPCDVFDDEE